MTDIDYMRKAYALALNGKGRTSPNPMVGSVIVRGHKIIAEGWHRRCGAEHAEVAALKKLNGKAAGCTMYVTLEPCFHYGRTPPCVDQIIQSGIRTVYIGMRDPNPLTNGKSVAKLRRAGVKTRVGFLRGELNQMNEAFIKYTKTKMPFVAVKTAQSLDGKIALANGDSKWITGKRTRDFARRIRDEFDAICVGINTVVKDNPGLNGARKSKKIKKIILDGRLRIPLNARLFTSTAPSDCIIITTSRASRLQKRKLIGKGVHIIECGEKSGWIDLTEAMKKVARLGITNVLIEGGAHVIGSALKANLVDKMYIYMAPSIFGDAKALDSVVGLDPKGVAKAVQLKNIKCRSINGDFLIEGYIKYRN